MKPRRRTSAPTGPHAIAGREVDTASVTLRFFGDDLDPADISRILGAEPTISRRKGDRIPDGRTAETGSWLLSAEPMSRSSLESQIDSLFARLTQEAGLWRPLALKYRGDLFCGLWSLEWNCGAELSAEMLQRISARGLRMCFDIYYVDSNGEPSPR
ncbi:MAG TPA: DUF4279 domain-containing protein [Kofleriaceae bacterium]|nr:DUF4279 domain-containing protein [Kofleriaceae bacterium]